MNTQSMATLGLQVFSEKVFGVELKGPNAVEPQTLPPTLEFKELRPRNDATTVWGLCWHIIYIYIYNHICLSFTTFICR